VTSLVRPLFTICFVFRKDSSRRLIDGGRRARLLGQRAKLAAAHSSKERALALAGRRARAAGNAAAKETGKLRLVRDDYSSRALS